MDEEKFSLMEDKIIEAPVEERSNPITVLYMLDVCVCVIILIALYGIGAPSSSTFNNSQVENKDNITTQANK